MTRRASPYQVSTLPSGAALVVRRMPDAVSAAIGIWIHAGGRYETQERAGISHFVEHLLFKGTRRRSCEALKQAVEGVGGTLNGFTAEEFTCYMAKVPRQYARRTLTILGEMVREPTLTAADVEKEREVILEEVRMYEDTPGQLVHDLLNQLLWPNHPLGTLLSGTIDTVRRIRHEDLVAYWRQMYQPQNVVVSCAGGVDPEAVARQVRETFGGRRRGRLSRFPRVSRPRRGLQVRVWKKPTEQTHLCLGAYAVPRTHPDRFALELLHVLLGANMSSRLFREVREKRGLVYEIGTHIKRFHDTGAFVVSAGCDAGKLEPTLRTICRELGRVRRGAIARAELRRAKDYYAGQLLMGLEDPMDHMMWMGEQMVTTGRVAAPEFLLDHLAKVTAADVRRVARHLFVTPRLHVAVVGPLGDGDSARLAQWCDL